MGLEGRVALVTGGGRGIGRAVSLALAEDGADVAINYRRDEQAAEETLADVEKLGRRAAKYHASVDSWDEDEAMVNAVLADFGGVDILVNNAGIASRGHSVVNTDPAEFERVWRIHTFGSFALAKLVLPSMRERPRGDIVMVSSNATVHIAGWSSPYNVAKAGEGRHGRRRHRHPGRRIGVRSRVHTRGGGRRRPLPGLGRRRVPHRPEVHDRRRHLLTLCVGKSGCRMSRSPRPLRLPREAAQRGSGGRST